MKRILPLLITFVASVKGFSTTKSVAIVYFLFIGLTIGAAILYLLQRLVPTLPYTVAVFIAGLLISLFSDFRDPDDTFQLSISEWNNINPMLILYLFLPALIFGDAMALNFHHVKGVFVPSTLLAFPGAVVSTFAVAAALKLLPLGWPWSYCYAFGAITCATDPVGEFRMCICDKLT